MMFIRRLITSLIITAIAAIVLFVFPAWALAILVTVFIALGLNEFFILVENKEIGVNRRLGIVLGAAVPLATYFDYKIPQDWFFVFIPAICLIIFIIQFTKRDNRAVLSISAILFGLVYVSWFLSFLIRIRTMPLGTELLRKYLIAYLILVAKSGDIGAYLIGTRLGRHSLIPRISPKKTVEGMVGGLAFSVLVSLACVGFLPSFSLFHLFILGLLLGALAQIGDLSESLIKRDCGVKDSGRTLPGLGGVLDTIDSLLFTAPVFYFYVKVFM
ncbi:MAG: phosphatidate cytidylyltransferase [Candidatus Omnitrophica bacterium]|nr:phosphatidate cytidylyltransferase [Candidatus Omnitrophota bacterium]MBU4140370.1 phosphatidate cytidylyltransferase [Candidatus Omnitrophota bacterium]